MVIATYLSWYKLTNRLVALRLIIVVQNLLTVAVFQVILQGRIYILVKTQKVLQVCKQVVTNLFTSCEQVVFALYLIVVVVTSLEQAVDNLSQAWWHYQTCSNVVLTSLIRSWYNNNVTRLMTQGCNNIVISWLHRTCWNNLATSLIISTRLLYKLLTACSKLLDNLGQAVRTQKYV